MNGTARVHTVVDTRRARSARRRDEVVVVTGASAELWLSTKRALAVLALAGVAGAACALYARSASHADG